jgi:hypothetical protein
MAGYLFGLLVVTVYGDGRVVGSHRSRLRVQLTGTARIVKVWPGEVRVLGRV